MYKIQVILSFLLIHFSQSQKIAVIGTGIGGASLTHYLNESFEGVDITVFEKQDRIGGRTHSVDIHGIKKELGAHFLISDNKNVIELVEKYGLSFKEEENKTFGIYKNNEIKFQSSSFKLLTLGKMIYRYGLSFLSFMRKQSQELKKFLQIYEFQAEEKTFETLDQFLDICQQRQYFNKTAQEVFVSDLGANQLFSDEVLDSFISNFYNQNYDVNGFAGMITAAGLQGSPREIKEGFNAISSQIFETASKSQNTKIILNSNVISVNQIRENSKFNVTYQVKKENKAISQVFDLVVLAAPLEMADISFDKSLGIVNEKRKTFPIYKYVVATETLNPTLLGLSSKSDIPDVILTPDRIFGKISILDTMCRDCYELNGKKVNLYAWTGKDKLTDEELKSLFNQGEFKIIFQFQHQYPYPDMAYSRGKPMQKIILQKGLYYLNGMEYLSSCAELQTIAAKNVVNLIKKREGKNWKRKVESIKSTNQDL